jgi:hypothetical protein
VIEASPPDWRNRACTDRSLRAPAAGGRSMRLVAGADPERPHFARAGGRAGDAMSEVRLRTGQALRSCRGLSFKKRELPAEQLRPKVAWRRKQWKKFQARPDPTSLVFVDGVEDERKADGPGPRPTWLPCAAGPRSASASMPRCLMVTGRQ